MHKPLRAVVIGAGYAGEGHTLALRYTGVDVVAICARQPGVLQSVADRLEIPRASVDWRRTLEMVKPDIVALATPASLRGEVIELATSLGCHLFCDKPLATTAEEASRLYRLVERTGVKHAYVANNNYDPGIVWLGELVRDGAIGTLREIEYTLRFNLAPMTPWSWFDDLAAGGGFLNNWFTHVLSMVMALTGGELRRAMGQARPLRQQAPVVQDIHDFRIIMTGEKNPTMEEAAQLEWRACDADGAFSALLDITTSGEEVSVTMAASATGGDSWPPSGWRLYGDKGSLVAEGFESFAIYRLRNAAGDREPLPVPKRVLDDWPVVGDSELSSWSHDMSMWAAMARDFVADIRAEPHRPYLTFRDGWRFQEVIDAIRSGRGWYDLPE